MNDPKATPGPPRHLGPALHRSDAELDRLAQITPADIADAADLWRGRAPAEFKGLLDATVEPEPAKPRR